MVLQGSLQKVHARKSFRDLLRHQQHQKGRATADHHRIDQHAQCLHKAHLDRVVALCGGSCTGCRTAARFVGEQAALDTVHQHSTKAASHGLPQTERFRKDAPEHRRELGQVEQHDAHGDDKIAHRHDGHHHVQTFHGGILAQHDHRRNGREHQCGSKRRNMERIFKRGTDRVGDHLTDAAPADEARHRKQRRYHRAFELFAAPALRQHMQIVGRSAAPAAVQRVGLAVFLGKGGFDKGGGRTQNGSDPHPEHRTGTACRNSGHHAHQIAHAHAGGGGNDQRLEGGKAVPALLFLAHGGDHIPEQPHRQKTGAAGEPDARREQQHHHEGNADAAAQRDGEQVAPQKAIDGFDKIYQQGRFLL